MKISTYQCDQCGTNFEKGFHYRLLRTATHASQLKRGRPKGKAAKALEGFDLCVICADKFVVKLVVEDDPDVLYAHDGEGGLESIARGYAILEERSK